MSCCTACCVVFNCAATACWVPSSFEEALQPNASPPIAIKPRTMIAGNVQAGDSVRPSTILSSDIVNLSPHPIWGNSVLIGLYRSGCTHEAKHEKARLPVSDRGLEGSGGGAN